jgi:hypothetical protein
MLGMSQADRDKRLDELLAAVNTYADKRTKEINDRVALAKRILKGRTGSERLANAANNAAKSAVIESIDDFLTGGNG